MALAVASTSTTSGSGVDSLTITKPSGVASGDLLIAIFMGDGGGSPAISGFSALEGISYDYGPQAVEVFAVYRIADSSDVSASDYTVTLVGATSLGIATMYRITGWSTGNPLYQSSTTSGQQDSASYSIGASSLSLNRSSSTLMIMVAAQHSEDNTASFSGYSVTSGESNPTWTEVQDTNVSVLAGANFISMANAYANSTSATPVTAWTLTASSAITGGDDGHAGFLIIIAEPQNVTTDVSHLAVTPAIFGPTVTQITVNADVSHNAVTPVLNGLTAKAQRQAVWENPDKPTTTWVNPDK